MDNTTNTLLMNYPEAVQHLAEATRKLILKQIPGITEMPDIPAKVIGYGFSNKYADTICTIILSQKEIKLGFYKGAALPDPNSLLTGTGKVHKYVPIRKAEDIQAPVLTALINAAYSAWQQRKKG